MVDKLIKRKEAAEMLGISLDTLDHAHRARPKDNNPTFRKKRTARSEIRHR